MENNIFSLSWAFAELIILKIITRIFSAIPNAMATTNTVLSCPINGRFVIADTGLNQRASIISSNPNTLPNINPKNMEKIPAMEIIPARLIFFVRYRIPPIAKRQKPWPRSPNMAPNINV